MPCWDAHLRIILPPTLLAYNQLNSAVRAPPTCRLPVGDGANRTRTCPRNRRWHGSTASLLSCKLFASCLPVISVELVRASEYLLSTGILCLLLDGRSRFQGCFLRALHCTPAPRVAVTTQYRKQSKAKTQACTHS